MESPTHRPAQFPFKIDIDLFDGILTGTQPAQVRFLETVNGKLVDFDFDRDVALVRIRPGRRLAATRVVPTHWQPLVGMQVLTVGCSAGNDATAWNAKITNARFHDLPERLHYEAIECTIGPKQGRAGGGMFTMDGFLAGVCNYAEPRGNHGFYATPGSIYHLLDRNGLAFVHERVESDEGKLNDQIRSIQDRMERDHKELQRLKELRQEVAQRRLQDPHAVSQSRVDLRAAPSPIVQSHTGATDSADHEHRLRDLEQKMDKLLERLEKVQPGQTPGR